MKIQAYKTEKNANDKVRKVVMKSNYLTFKIGDDQHDKTNGMEYF